MNHELCESSMGRGMEHVAPISAMAFAAAMTTLDLPADALLAVAVSGGADSMALLRLLGEWAPGRLRALTVDHRLRDGSDREAAQVNAWCRALGVPHHTLTWDGRADRRGASGSCQTAAREARYRLLEDWCRREGIAYLFVAHHAEDQVETFLIRLSRGSGLDGLAAMAPMTRRGSIMLVRPLLNFTKAELLATCRACNQAWIEDPSNDNPVSARVRFRRARGLLAAEGLSDRRLLATIAHLQRARSALAKEVEARIALACRWNAWGGAEVRLDALLEASDEVGLRALAHVLTVTSGASYGPRFHSLERLWRSLRDKSYRRSTLHGCIVERRADALAVWREPAAIDDRQAVAAGRAVLWDGRFEIALAQDAPAGIFTLEAALPAAWRLAIAEGAVPAVPVAARGTVPMLCDDRGVAMIPTAGFIRLDLRPFWQEKVSCRWVAARVRSVTEITPFAEM